MSLFSRASCSLRLPCLGTLSHPWLQCRAKTSKVDVKLLARLRQETQASMTSAKEALLEADNDYEKASGHLKELLAASGQAKAVKLAGRQTAQGVLALALMSTGRQEGIPSMSRAALIELNCESDFVARNDLFKKLAKDIANTVMILHDPDPGMAGTGDGQHIQSLDVPQLAPAPLLPADPGAPSTDLANVVPRSIESAVQDGIAKLGENIKLSRAAVASLPDASVSSTGAASEHFFASAFVHNDSIGALVLMKATTSTTALNKAVADDLQKVARAIARQVTAFETKTVGSLADLVISRVDDSSGVLLEQPAFAMASLGVETSGSVGQALQDWAKPRQLTLKIVQFKRWELGL